MYRNVANSKIGLSTFPAVAFLFAITRRAEVRAKALQNGEFNFIRHVHILSKVFSVSLIELS